MNQGHIEKKTANPYDFYCFVFYAAKKVSTKSVYSNPVATIADKIIFFSRFFFFC